VFFVQNFGAKNYKAVFWVRSFGAKNFEQKMRMYAKIDTCQMSSKVGRRKKAPARRPRSISMMKRQIQVGANI